MSYAFSKQSLERLAGVDKRLQDLCFKVIQIRDCTIAYGVRTEAEQRHMVAIGASETMDSRHLTGHAVDIYPYPINWKHVNDFMVFAGLMIATAHWMDIPLRWGGDWDCDWDLYDQKFEDLGHFEIPRGSE